MRQTTSSRGIKGSRSAVLYKEYYSVEEVSRLLHISERTIRELAHREDDPLPFRILFGQQRNCFIHREDLMYWLESNSQLVRDAAKKQTGQA